jgi:hypothetical protein
MVVDEVIGSLSVLAIPAGVALVVLCAASLLNYLATGLEFFAIVAFFLTGASIISGCCYLSDKAIAKEQQRRIADRRRHALQRLSELEQEMEAKFPPKKRIVTISAARVVSGELTVDANDLGGNPVHVLIGKDASISALEAAIVAQLNVDVRPTNAFNIGDKVTLFPGCEFEDCSNVGWIVGSDSSTPCVTYYVRRLLRDSVFPRNAIKRKYEINRFGVLACDGFLWTPHVEHIEVSESDMELCALRLALVLPSGKLLGKEAGVCDMSLEELLGEVFSE